MKVKCCVLQEAMIIRLENENYNCPLYHSLQFNSSSNPFFLFRFSFHPYFSLTTSIDAHILFFFSSFDIDRFISTEIPNKERNPKLYAIVEKFIVHGPYGHYNKSSPCMMNNRCSKFFPKSFRSRTIIDDAGFPKYRRRDDGQTITKRNCILNNSFIVLYNPTLLLKYGCHINVEYTCQILQSNIFSSMFIREMIESLQVSFKVMHHLQVKI